MMKSTQTQSLNTKSAPIVLLIAAAVVLAVSSSAHAALIVYETPPGATIDGQPVSAKVTLTTSADHITVVLENLQEDPTSVAQNLSGFLLTVSTGQTSGTLVTSSAIHRTVAGDGGYSDGAAGDTGWLLRTTGGELDLYVLGAPVGPAHTIIGPPDGSDKYGSAKGSIAGNAPHNPFLAETATFELDVPGVTTDSGIASVTFGFGTSPGDTITVPEPATMALLALGFAGMGVLRRRRK